MAKIKGVYTKRINFFDFSIVPIAGSCGECRIIFTKKYKWNSEEVTTDCIVCGSPINNDEVVNGSILIVQSNNYIGGRKVKVKTYIMPSMISRSSVDNYLFINPLIKESVYVNITDLITAMFPNPSAWLTCFEYKLSNTFYDINLKLKIYDVNYKTFFNVDGYLYQKEFYKHVIANTDERIEIVKKLKTEVLVDEDLVKFNTVLSNLEARLQANIDQINSTKYEIEDLFRSLRLDSLGSLMFKFEKAFSAEARAEGNLIRAKDEIIYWKNKFTELNNQRDKTLEMVDQLIKDKLGINLSEFIAQNNTNTQEDSSINIDL